MNKRTERVLAKLPNEVRAILEEEACLANVTVEQIVNIVHLRNTRLPANTAAIEATASLPDFAVRALEALDAVK